MTQCNILWYTKITCTNFSFFMVVDAGLIGTVARTKNKKPRKVWNTSIEIIMFLLKLYHQSLEKNYQEVYLRINNFIRYKRHKFTNRFFRTFRIKSKLEGMVIARSLSISPFSGVSLILYNKDIKSHSFKAGSSKLRLTKFQ